MNGKLIVPKASPTGKTCRYPPNRNLGKTRNHSWRFEEPIPERQQEEINKRERKQRQERKKERKKERMKERKKTLTQFLGNNLKCKFITKASLFVRAQCFRRFEFYKDGSDTKKKLRILGWGAILNVCKYKGEILVRGGWCSLIWSQQTVHSTQGASRLQVSPNGNRVKAHMQVRHQGQDVTLISVDYVKTVRN